VTTAEAGRPQRAATAARLQFALGSFVVSAILTAIGTFQGDDDHAWRNWLIVLAISAAVTAIVFWVVVPRIGNLARGALILAVVGAPRSSSSGSGFRWCSPALQHSSRSRRDD
jgi:hypothetical protein